MRCLDLRMYHKYGNNCVAGSAQEGSRHNHHDDEPRLNIKAYVPPTGDGWGQTARKDDAAAARISDRPFDTAPQRKRRRPGRPERGSRPDTDHTHNSIGAL
jgi:hypothetical protein